MSGVGRWIIGARDRQRLGLLRDEKTEHIQITNALRKLLPYGATYTKAQVWKAYKMIYRSHADWLNAIRNYFY